MKNAFGLVFAAGLTGLLFLGSGCAWGKGGEPAAAPDASAIALEMELGNRLIDAFCDNDGKEFVALLPEEMRKRFDVDEFKLAYENTRGALGEAVSFEYFGELETPVFRVLLWKVRFRRETSDGETVHQEALFRVVTGRVDDKPQVVSFGFI